MSRKTNTPRKTDFKTDVINKLEDLYENGLYIDDKKLIIKTV